MEPWQPGDGFRELQTLQAACFNKPTATIRLQVSVRETSRLLGIPVQKISIDYGDF